MIDLTGTPYADMYSADGSEAAEEPVVMMLHDTKLGVPDWTVPVPEGMRVPPVVRPLVTMGRGRMSDLFTQEEVVMQAPFVAPVVEKPVVEVVVVNVPVVDVPSVKPAVPKGILKRDKKWDEKAESMLDDWFGDHVPAKSLLDPVVCRVPRPSPEDLEA